MVDPTCGHLRLVAVLLARSVSVYVVTNIPTCGVIILARDQELQQSKKHCFVNEVVCLTIAGDIVCEVSLLIQADREPCMAVTDCHTMR